MEPEAQYPTSLRLAIILLSLFLGTFLVAIDTQLFPSLYLESQPDSTLLMTLDGMVLHNSVTIPPQLERQVVTMQWFSSAGMLWGHVSYLRDKVGGDSERATTNKRNMRRSK